MSFTASQEFKKLYQRLFAKVTEGSIRKTCPLWILLITLLQPGNSPLSTTCHSPLFSQLLICLNQLLIIPVLICTISTLNNNFLWELYWMLPINLDSLSPLHHCSLRCSPSQQKETLSSSDRINFRSESCILSHFPLTMFLITLCSNPVLRCYTVSK